MSSRRSRRSSQVVEAHYGIEANAAYHLGLIAEARGDLGEASRFYRLTLRLAPGHQQAARMAERIPDG